MGCHKLYKTGYVSGEHPGLIAALMLEAHMLYPKDRDKALRFLSGFENDIKRKRR
jgi:hypothetical protein